MKQALYIVAMAVLVSCNTNSQNMTNKAKNTPEVQQMLEAFNKQEHRLEFNTCDMLYNAKPFKLGMTIKELISVFGNFDDFHRGKFIWKDIGIICASDSKKKNVDSKFIYIYIYIYMNTEVSDEYKESLKHKLFHKNDYFLVEGMPIDKNTVFKDFIANSNYELNDFAISDRDYKHTMQCNETGVKTIYSFNLPGGWNYKGAGHLRFKDTPNKNNTHVIDYMSIHLEE